MMIVRLAHEIEKDSIVDGEGIRTVIWFQGCCHNCDECHNPETHDVNGGIVKKLDEMLLELDNSDFQDGITFTGGEPLLQLDAVLAIAEKYADKNLWLYTGYNYEKIIALSETNHSVKKLLSYLDVIVDGKYEKERRSLTLPFRGSANQRIINVAASLKKNRVVEKKYHFKKIKKRKENRIYI